MAGVWRGAILDLEEGDVHLASVRARQHVLTHALAPFVFPILHGWRGGNAYPLHRRLPPRARGVLRELLT